MKRALGLLLFLGACGGPLSGVSLQSGSESQRRALMSLTFPAIDRTDGVMRGWKGAEPGSSTVRDLLFALYGIEAAAAAQVATDRPVGISVARVDLPGPRGPEPTAVNAMAFALRESVSTEAWLESLGKVQDRSGPLALVTQSARVALDGPSRQYGWLQTGRLYFHQDGNYLILSNTLEGLTVAGPAARAARLAADGDLVVKAYPQVWARQRVKDLARQLAELLDFLRRGSSKEQPPSRTAGILAAANALYYLQPFAAADQVDFALKVSAAGAELQVRTTPGASPAPGLAPVLDRALVGEDLAALGALDCRQRIGARQRLLISAWQATGGPGVAELGQLVDAEQAALDGTCSFAVHTAGEVWSEEASYPLRAGASGPALVEALKAAIRSGGLPNLEGAADDLKTDKLLLSIENEVVSLDRVLGAAGSPQTRHAAALHGAAILHQRFTVRAGRFLALSGAHADERLTQLGKGTPALPPELERALASGRGKGGFVFLDLTALWKPYLKAAQVIQSPIARVVAKDPTLLQERRPLVVTLEPRSNLDATITMPPQTFGFLLIVAALLFG